MIYGSLIMFVNFRYKQSAFYNSYSMKGINIQFQGIIKFIDNSLTSRTHQSLDCYLLNLQKITLQTFTILHIALTNAPDEVPLEVVKLLEETSSKFKEYFRSKPKSQNEKAQLYYQEYDEVQQFLDNRPELVLSNESERGQLYKFLNENEEKERNNQMLLDNIPKYAYLSPQMPLDTIKKHSRKQVEAKEKAQQTYPSDFVVKPECIYPSLNTTSQEREVQTEKSLETIKAILEQYSQQILQGQEDPEQTKKRIGQLFLCFNSTAAELLNKSLQNLLGTEFQNITEAQKMKFIEQIIHNNEGLSGNDNDCFKLFGGTIKNKEVKKNPKCSKNLSKRGSQMGKIPEKVGGKSLMTSNKDVLQRVDENAVKSMPSSGKALENVKKMKPTERNSISKFGLKMEKARNSKPSQFSQTSLKKIGSQTKLASNQEAFGQATARKTKFFENSQKNKNQESRSKSKQSSANQIDKRQTSESPIKKEQQRKKSKNLNKNGGYEPNNDGRSARSNDNSSCSGSKGVRDTIREQQDPQPLQKDFKKKEDIEIESKLQDSEACKKSELLDISEEKRKEDNWALEDNIHPMNQPEISQEQNESSSKKKIQLLPAQDRSLPALDKSFSALDKSFPAQDTYSPAQDKSLPALDKSHKHTSLPHDQTIQSLNKNELSAAVLLTKNKDQATLQYLKQTFKSANSSSHESLHFNHTQKISHNLFAPKNSNYSMYKPQNCLGRQKLPTVSRDQRSETEQQSRDISFSQKQQLMTHQNQRILCQIKQNCSTRKNKNVQWVKLVKNIKEYQKLHFRFCGQSCIHLAKFYNFLKRHNLSMYVNRKQLSLHKKNIEINASLQ